MKVADIRKHFISELEKENFTTDKTGAKTIELIGASFVADEESIFGKPNEDYIKVEINSPHSSMVITKASSLLFI